MTTSTKICPHCGARLPVRLRFCPICQQAAEPEDERQTPPQAAPTAPEPQPAQTEAAPAARPEEPAPEELPLESPVPPPILEEPAEAGCEAAADTLPPEQPEQKDWSAWDDTYVPIEELTLGLSAPAGGAQQPAPDDAPDEPAAAGVERPVQTPDGADPSPLSIAGSAGSLLALCLPLVGLAIALIWALGGCRNLNRRNLSKARILLTLTLAAAGAVALLAVEIFVGPASEVLPVWFSWLYRV